MTLKSKRAYGVTTSEISAVFYFLSVLVGFMVIWNLGGMRVQVAGSNPQLAMQFQFMMTLLFVSGFFSLISMFLPNYQITKNNLNLLIDRITNPDYIGWIRYTRDRGLCLHTVKKDTMGRTKGLVNEKKATVINNGDSTINLMNGNKAIVVNDFLSQNDNLEENLGWNLISKCYGGLIGFKAYEKAVDSGNTLFDIVDEESTGNEVIDLD